MPQIPEIHFVERPLHIAEVLNRRTDLSTFVVHLTRDHEGQSAKDRLLAIVGEQRLRLGDSPRGWAVGVRNEQGALVLNEQQRTTQRAICFSETPLEHIYAMFANIANRDVNLRPYGLALTKMVARRSGINPVWYVDITDGHALRARTALNDLVKRACRDGWFDEVKDLFPYIEGMLTRRDQDGNVTLQREWWWEREWRYVGSDLSLALVRNKVLWLCPEDDIPEVEAAVRQHDAAAPVYCIDPNWGLERIIGRLMGLAETDLTPFSAR